MSSSRDLCLALTLCLLGTLPLSSVRAQTTFTCSPITSLRMTSVACVTVGGCTPTPPGTVAMVSSFVPFPLTGTCSLANDLTLTLGNGAIACGAIVTSCEGGVVVPVGSFESAESVASVDSVASGGDSR